VKARLSRVAAVSAPARLGRVETTDFLVETRVHVRRDASGAEESVLRTYTVRHMQCARRVCRRRRRAWLGVGFAAPPARARALSVSLTLISVCLSFRTGNHVDVLDVIMWSSS
jgi:hypothetical protein